MFTKCGQKDNKKYSFGMKKDEEKQVKTVCNAFCKTCGSKASENTKFCGSCGEKIK